MLQWLRKTYVWMFAVPILFIVLGAVSNQAVLIANDGKFPVMINQVMLGPDSQWVDSQKDLEKYGMLDDTHCVMTKDTHLNFLADVFNVRDRIKSIGDMFIDLGYFLWGWTPLAWGCVVVRKLSEEKTGL